MEFTRIHHPYLDISFICQVRTFLIHIPELQCDKVNSGKWSPIHHDDVPGRKTAIEQVVETHNSGGSLL
jgi:hypothetical protein